VPLSLPAFLRSIAGKDRVPVKETQEYKMSEDEKKLEIFSLPLSQIPGGAKFNTKLEYTVEQQEEGVSVTAKVFSHASGPFGLGGAIEGVMLEVGTVQTQHWLEFSRERCMAAPTKWWQQAGKLSRAVSRRFGSKRVMSPEMKPAISKTLEKIESDLDILEALEPKVNLGEVAKNILSDAQLKEQYAKTMMRTLFMLETAEDNSIDLTPQQALELRDMLVQLQKTLANITSRRDELLDACLEYETDSSERVRALAQELQRERVGRHLLGSDSANDLYRDGDWEKFEETVEGDFPGWGFLADAVRGSSSSSSRGSPLAPQQLSPATSAVPCCGVPQLGTFLSPRNLEDLFLGSSSTSSRPTSRRGHSRSQSNASNSSGSVWDGARSFFKPLQELLSKPKPQVPPRSSRRPQLHRTSDSVGSFCISGVGEVVPQVDASAGSFSSNSNSSSSEVSRSRDEGAAEHQSVPLTACRPRRRKSPADGPFSGLSVDVFLCGGACSVWELWRRHGEACLARCRAHCTSGSASSPDACPHKLLLTLTMELAEEELPREQTEEHAQDAKAESLGQKNIELKSQVAEMKRQLYNANREGSAAIARQQAKRGGFGSTLLRRALLAGVVVLVGRWGLRRRVAIKK